MIKMKEEHLSADEMLEFLSYNKVDDHFFELSAKVNSHIAVCDECKKAYKSLVAASEKLNQILVYIPKSEKMKFNIVKGLFFLESEKNTGKKKIGDYISMLQDFSFSIKLKVKGYTELAYENIIGESQFYHPAFATSLKSYSEGSTERADGEILSTLIDGDKNRITIGADRTLSVFLNKDVCFEDSVVLLIPQNESLEPHFEYAKEFDDHLMVARFDDVDEGDYIVALRE